MTKATTKAAETAIDNAHIWAQVEASHPKYVKEFNRGGFRGTAINPTWLAKRATEVFGPVGIGWGFDIAEETYREGGVLEVVEGNPTRETIHVIKLALWYLHPVSKERGHVVQFGQTTFVGRNKNGVFTDEEAPKKSMTDAMSKCLSLLGFSTDIHMGMWDDNKYVNDRKQAVIAEVKAKAAEKTQTGGPPNAGLDKEPPQPGEVDDRSAYDTPANDRTPPAANDQATTADVKGTDDETAKAIAAKVKTLATVEEVDKYRLEVDGFVAQLRAAKKRALLSYLGAAFNGRRSELSEAA